MQRGKSIPPLAGEWLWRLLVIFVGYWAAWNSAKLVNVFPDVSAFYISAGLSAALPMLWGWRCMPAIYAAITAARLMDMPGWTFADIDYLGALRQVLVYGMLGLYLRRVWNQPGYRFSLRRANHFISLAFVASLGSAVLTLGIPPFDKLPPEQVGPVFLSFWGGDFAGLMITLPALLILRAGLVKTLAGGEPGLWSRFVSDVRPLSLLLHCFFALVVALFSVALPALLEVEARLSILVLFPVVLAGLSRGTIAGFMAAGVVGTTFLLAGMSLGFPTGEPIELQLVLAISAAMALMAGAAHDDQEHEWKLANFDSVTGLPNRLMLMDRLDQALTMARRTHAPLAVLYLDLDRFKEVNDTLGHHMGDLLLKMAATRMRTCVRESDTVARLGGDEFVVLLPALAGDGLADRVARDILAVLEKPFVLGFRQASVSASIGVALFPGDGEEAATLLKRADQAMYEAKKQGRNRCQYVMNSRQAVAAAAS